MTHRFLIALLTLGFAFTAFAPASAGDFYAGLDAYRAGDFETAMAEWLPMARQGDPDAQYRVGRLHARGHGVDRDDGIAVEWFLKSANQRYAPAQNDLGQMYEQGRGVEQDDSEAVRWFRAAAEAGRGVGQANLAMMYDQGRGVAQDDDAAFRWYRRAAQQDNARAQNNLGLMYESGRGAAQDASKAAGWYRKAARQDYAAGQFNLGRLYEQGLGVERDRGKATKWYTRAAREGMPEARERLDAMHAASPPEGPAPAPVAGGVAIATSATEAHPETTTIEPSPASDSRATPGTPKASYDLTEPAELRDLRGRAEAGDAEAQHELGVAYATGQSVAPDDVEAGRWYRKAATQGHAMAGYRLAFMYFKGRGVAEHRDYVRAYTWFTLSAERGVGDAETWRAKLARKMSKDEIAEATRMAEELRN